ncbi:MAG: hypothetical protein CSB33_00875 [Desulfobacterales bacterium]|nr:MAG: hypothetical protein CSB33_00875 [Desulfobacterales bacterium]
MTRTTYVSAPRAALAVGAAGAIIGGAVAAARNYGKMRNDEMTSEEAVKNVLRESGTTGIATATGAAVMGGLGLTGLLSLAGMVVVTAGAKHLTDRLIDGNYICGASRSAKPDLIEEDEKGTSATK